LVIRRYTIGILIKKQKGKIILLYFFFQQYFC